MKSAHKHKRGKRFGKSIHDRSPAMFLSLLGQKPDSTEGMLFEVDTASFKASQYDPTTGKCVKIPLGKRMKQIGGKTVQRDLYSAFLMMNAQKNGKRPVRKQCMRKFDSFV